MVTVCFIHNEDGEATHATNVTMTGIYATENYWSGIWVVNKGSITMTNVASWGHMTTGTGYGAYLDNDAGTGSIDHQEHHHHALRVR